jgi:hypothetical protein
MKKHLLTILFILCSCGIIVKAQTAAGGSPSPQWWLSSSLIDTADNYLFHFEGQYSYTKMTGSMDGETHTGGIKVALRKNIFTNQAEYAIDKMNLNIKMLGMYFASETHAFTDYIDIDITPLLFAEGGFIWERDNSLYIKNRYSWYAGGGLNGLIYEKHFLKLLVALGRIDQSYTIPVDDIDVVKGAYTAFYIRQRYKYQMDERLSILMQAYYLTNINQSERYRLSASMNLIIGIINPVSLVLGYSYKYDKEAELLKAGATNTIQSLGINISL